MATWGGYQVEGFSPIWFLPQPSKTYPPFIVMWFHGLDCQSPLDYFVINVFFCFHHQEELGGSLFIFAGDLGGFNFIVETLGHCVFDTNVRIFSNCFFRQTSFKSVVEGFIALHNFDNMVAITAWVNCHVMGFPPDVFNKTSKTFLDKQPYMKTLQIIIQDCQKVYLLIFSCDYLEDNLSRLTKR